MITATGVNSSDQLVKTQEATIQEFTGKDDFLNLLVTQLKNQDPLNPLDSSEFTAQLAQFSSLEQLYNINNNLESLAEVQKSSNNLLATSYIGRRALSYGNTFCYGQSEGNKVSFELEAAANSVFINISDTQGNVVRTIENGQTDSGKTELIWDGLDNNGVKVADGVYTFEVFAYNQNNEVVDCVPYTESAISGITYDEGETYLNSGQFKIPLSSVFRIFDDQPQS